MEKYHYWEPSVDWSTVRTYRGPLPTPKNGPPIGEPEWFTDGLDYEKYLAGEYPDAGDYFFIQCEEEFQTDLKSEITSESQVVEIKHLTGTVNLQSTITSRSVGPYHSTNSTHCSITSTSYAVEVYTVTGTLPLSSTITSRTVAPYTGLLSLTAPITSTSIGLEVFTVDSHNSLTTSITSTSHAVEVFTVTGAIALTAPITSDSLPFDIHSIAVSLSLTAPISSTSIGLEVFTVASTTALSTSLTSDSDYTDDTGPGPQPDGEALLLIDCESTIT